MAGETTTIMDPSTGPAVPTNAPRRASDDFSPYRMGRWTVTRLKEELKNRSASIKGSKEQLIERLEELDDGVRPVKGNRDSAGFSQAALPPVTPTTKRHVNSNMYE